MCIRDRFRTPLTLIQGALEKIQRWGKIPKEMAYSLKVMDKSTQRMLRLINQLLEFRKMPVSYTHLGCPTGLQLF